MRHIIVETVGAGQVQTEIVNIAHTVVIVLQPDAGDSIQASKASLSEIGNIFVINKSDLPGAEKAANHLSDLWSAGYKARLG
jgi:LAO/AO transport system kinase